MKLQNKEELISLLNSCKDYKENKKIIEVDHYGYWSLKYLYDAVLQNYFITLNDLCQKVYWYTRRFDMSHKQAIYATIFNLERRVQHCFADEITTKKNKNNS